MLTAGSSTSSTRTLFAAVLFLGLLAMTARPATDPDLWWHLRAGQWMVETGRVPHSDPFSFTRAGEPWVAHEWLSEVLFYALWKLGGPAALILFSALATTAGFLILYFRCPTQPHWAAAAVVVAAWASAPCWGTRAQMFTFLFASFLLWLMERAGDRPRLLLWIPPLFLLWVNLHAGFALGPVLLFLYAAGLILESATGATPWSEARPLVRRLLLCSVVCLVLVPLNPNGARLYRYPFETVSDIQLRSLIVEWNSPDFHRSMYLPLLLVLLILLAAVTLSRVRLKGRVLLPLAFMLLSALDAVRHIPIFMLFAIPVVAQALPVFPLAASLSPPRLPAKNLRPLANSAMLILLAAFTLWRWTDLIRRQGTLEAASFPSQAVDYLRTANLTGTVRLFPYYDWGGYAIWNLYPKYRVFVDGRSDLYGDEFLKQFETIVRVQSGWRTALEDSHADAILIPPGCALAQALVFDPSWTAPYRDSKAIVFVRKPGAQTAPVPKDVTFGTIVKTRRK